jgi:hypothetical protein
LDDFVDAKLYDYVKKSIGSKLQLIRSSRKELKAACVRINLKDLEVSGTY